MRVHIPRIGTDDTVDLTVNDFERLAAADRFGEHMLTSDATHADIILFPQCHMVDWRLRAIREHPVTRRYWAKVMVYDERDRPWRSFPGIYVSTPARSFDRTYQRAWSYQHVPDLPEAVGEPEPDLLFSFVGSNTAPCRRPLFDMRHPDAVVGHIGDLHWLITLGYRPQTSKWSSVGLRSHPEALSLRTLSSRPRNVIVSALRNAVRRESACDHL